MTLQNKIIRLMKVKSIITPSIEIRKCVNFLKKYLLNHWYLKSLILGISGGQDSTLTGKLCQIAAKELRKETKNKKYQFLAIRMPYGNQHDEEDCKDSINFIKPDQIIYVNIKNAVLNSEKSLKIAGIEISDYIKGNEKSRERMKVQYSIAAVKKGIVVGSGHAAELVTGFFTKYGDNATDINPISRLNKRQGRLLLKFLKCPPHLYLKNPTADLEDKHPQKPDESVLGVTYNEIDDYLEGKKINDLSKKRIEKLYLQTKHKRKKPVTQ
ncbi:ammonia-dependent NAD(+) synthetase [Buchnera aphidicola (Muscaphis stroyani)]|uniref:NH(3)-dependent NAD(+) synthetase n=1 Tax=Buchnera aphidicola (Muscaphis stroyani) TaxID=1241869 RepID=A0A4D6Y589_9GAMM|nr:ammonia-dependent NAD(+) synthetase [Buchnera aphidicola]QCI24269.1 ammonia-dependent NAD(+) synthetase [Buchnera aphidicola (Muscaphis stroyani)]